ncbi:hypothetical protein CB1_001546001 [Camelus ferus]|nr:hypothetical protein CB1_001546001 [Camelus ferus]
MEDTALVKSLPDEDGSPPLALLGGRGLQQLVTSNEKHLESLKNAGSLLQALERLAPAGGTASVHLAQVGQTSSGGRAKSLSGACGVWKSPF